MPAISVVVPVYNVEPYLKRCVDSILAQTFGDFDLILVDDGSPDNCGRICDEYAKTDNRICVIHRDNGGLSAARNSGIDWSKDNSHSKWITFIDSDDWIHPRYLELLYNAVATTNMPVAITNFEMTGGKSPEIGNAEPQINTVNTVNLYKESYMQFITAWGKLYLKSDFDNIRYPEGKLHEDEFTTWKILFKYPKLAVIDLPLYAYFINNSGITKSKWNNRRADGLEAQLERIKAIENDPQLSPFYESTLRLTANTMAGYIETLQKTHFEGKEKTISFFRKKLKSFLKKYKKHIPFRGYGWAYGKAYPRLIKIFVFFADLCDLFKAKFFKNS